MNEDARHGLSPLYEAVLSFLLHKGVAGATASRAAAGFGSHQTIHSAKSELLSEHLPIRIEFIESPAKLDEVLPSLYDLVTDGLVEVQDTTILKPARREAPKASEPEAAPHIRRQGPAKLMRVFLGEADQWHGEPLYDAIVKRLRSLEVDGATVYRGILGYGAKGHTHKESFWHFSKDLPVMISAVDTGEKIAVAVEAVELMLGDGLIVTSDVESIRIVRGGPVEQVRDGASDPR
ncbi:MAG: DUF190 domain-containing protein [Acidobacteria bacterium]|nr:DUF190 domain-containing protein [Acidobacteriota bacterium]